MYSVDEVIDKDICRCGGAMLAYDGGGSLVRRQ